MHQKINSIKLMNAEITHEETVTRVLEALEKIRPFLINDGGDIELINVLENKVLVKLHGNCNGCPMSFSTIKLGVETTIKQYAPEIHVVESVN